MGVNTHTHKKALFSILKKNKNIRGGDLLILPPPKGAAKNVFFGSSELESEQAMDALLMEGRTGSWIHV